MRDVEVQGMGRWKGVIDRGASFSKTGLAGEVERSGSKMDNIRLVTGSVRVSE